MYRFISILALLSVAAAGSARSDDRPPAGCAAPATLAETDIRLDDDQAPGMRVKPLGGKAGTQTYLLVFAPGDEVLSGIRRFARARNLGSGSISAVGAFGCTVTGWYDRRIHRLRTRVLRGDREVASLAGNLSVLDGHPQPHLHVSVADAMGRVQGGHLVRGLVGAGLEVTVIATPQILLRVENPVGASFVPFLVP